MPDIFTLDMLPEDNKRQKLLSGLDNWELFNINLRNGFYYQYVRNMLHINNGSGTFSEVGQLAGISNTDWSWAPLFADFDNDGWNDLYITNGFMRDFTNIDVLKYNEEYMRSLYGQVEPRHLEHLLKRVPSSDVKNYIYRNNGGYTFTNKGKDWGMDIPSNSNGAAYSDLDNDGDRKQDLIVVGDWMPVCAFVNEGGKLNDRTEKYFDKQYRGWWNTVKSEDMNGDGRPDLVLGNLGLNSQCRVSDREPAELVYKDFDDNGGMDPILCFYIGGKSYPYLTRDELLDQMSIMRPRFPDYKMMPTTGCC